MSEPCPVDSRVEGEELVFGGVLDLRLLYLLVLEPSPIDSRVEVEVVVFGDLLLREFTVANPRSNIVK